MHLSEDDIRTKIVYEWLKSCNVSLNEIFIEYSIKLQFGHGQKTIRSRTDLLVQSNEGQNLLIIEVKKPSHKLTNGDEQQAKSYARSLVGEIAPFTILTNGKESRIFDSVTGELIKGGSVSKDHAYVKAGLKVTGDGIQARMEALEYLISLSSDNLIEFCRNQVNHRMKKLKGEDSTSQKKYIPAFCVERSGPRNELNKRLFPEKENEEPKKLVLVVGKPQLGKTCFMCQTVESYLDQGLPVLFFPAISLTNGLINAIKDDLTWCFHENNSEVGWITRLNRSAKKLNKRVIIFIDGWNEMIQHALELNEECERLNIEHLTIVISTTSPTIQNLLQDSRGNPTYVSDSVGVDLNIAKILSRKQLNNTSALSIVQIGRFSKRELEFALNRYAQYYGVTIPESEILKEPFYLRLACEFLHNHPSASTLSQSMLIRNSLIRKGGLSGLGEIQTIRVLKELADTFFSKGRPLPILEVPMNYQDGALIDRLQEAGIILLTNAETQPLLDFYLTNELNFSLAYVLHRWDELIASQSFGENELETLKKAAKNGVGNDALVWFFGLVENAHLIGVVLMKISFKDWFTTKLGQLLINSITDHINREASINLSWLYLFMEEYLNADLAENEYAPSIIFSYLNSGNLSKHQEEFWIRNLLKCENIQDTGIYETYIYQFYDEIEQFDWDGDTSLDVDLFEKFLFDDDFVVAKAASFYLAYACPYYHLGLIPKLASKYNEHEKGLQEILEFSCPQILLAMSDNYYGDMCPGWFSHAEEGSDEVIEEFWEQKKRWFPVMKLLDTKSELFKEIQSTLNTIKEFALIEDELDLYNDPNQLNLDF